MLLMFDCLKSITKYALLLRRYVRQECYGDCNAPSVHLGKHKNGAIRCVFCLRNTNPHSQVRICTFSIAEICHCICLPLRDVRLY